MNNTIYLISLAVVILLSFSSRAFYYYTRAKHAKYYAVQEHINSFLFVLVMLIVSLILDHHREGFLPILCSMLAGTVVAIAVASVSNLICKSIWPFDDSAPIKTVKISLGLQRAAWLVAAVLELGFAAFLIVSLFMKPDSVGIAIIIASISIFFIFGAVYNIVRAVRK